ncbi:ATP-binding protein [Sinomicrobium sp. M5D2P9]
MEVLLNKSVRLVRGVKTDSVRYLFDNILWKNRLIGIKGARGTGKTTLLLQRLKALRLPPNQATYWTLDDLYFTDSDLADTARLFYNGGGRVLFLDEVHKYPAWSQHIKNLYDEYDDLQIVFTGSSIIDIAKEEVDLSRRALMYTLYGMSYREYMNFKYSSELPVLSFDEIISGTQAWQHKFPEKFRPLEYFAEYLQQGYYPFSLEDEESFATRLQQVIRIIVEYDMAQLSGFDIRNARKLLQLLYILSANVPFKPNISELARKSHIHRNTINEYLNFLDEAQLIRQVYPAGISVSTLQKPEKILLNNPNLAFALAPNATDKGNLRETFFASQLAVHHKISLPGQGDFTINDTYVFEIGGRKKGRKQIEGVEHAFVVVDDVDFPVLHIPLWAFGMLY